MRSIEHNRAGKQSFFIQITQTMPPKAIYGSLQCQLIFKRLNIKSTRGPMHTNRGKHLIEKIPIFQTMYYFGVKIITYFTV